MKRLLLFTIVVIPFCFTGLAQDLSKEEALLTINDLFQESEEASGFHSLDLFSKRKLGDRDRSYADDTGIHFEEKVGDEIEEQFYKFSDLKKIVILKGEKAKYGPTFYGDHQMLIHFKQMGRLIIVGISAENVNPFVEAIRLLAPELKKVNYAS